MSEPTPLYHRVKQTLLEEIEGGEHDPSVPFVTEREVSERFGVSSTTAVRVLNELAQQGVLVRRRGRGTFIAENPQQTYRPIQNAHASSSAGAIACVIGKLEGQHCSEVLRGIESACREADLHLLLFGSRQDPEVERLNISRVSSADVRGLVVFPVSGHSNAAAFQALQRESVPMVMIDRYYPDLVTDVVTPDNFDLGYQVTSRLLDRGHRSIATLWANTETTSERDRLAGYIRALRERNAPVRSDLAALRSYMKLPARQRLEQLSAWLRSPERPTAFLAVNGFVLARVVADMIDLKVSIWEGIELASMDSLGPQEPLASVAGVLPSFEMGVRSVRLLLERIQHPDQPPEILALPVKVNVKRMSKDVAVASS